jgi:histidyl-tRNA synthetase
MYSLKDRGGEDLSLRPENTAGVVRAVLSNGLTQSTPLKFFYSGPMFRYERPQKGRFRQFHQIGVEILGVSAGAGRYRVDRARPAHPELRWTSASGWCWSSTRWAIPSRAAIATRSSRISQIAPLAELSEDSQRRLETNPLRILDSKDQGDIRIKSTRRPSKYLNLESRDFFGRVRDGLDRLGINIA